MFSVLPLAGVYASCELGCWKSIVGLLRWHFSLHEYPRRMSYRSGFCKQFPPPESDIWRDVGQHKQNGCDGTIDDFSRELAHVSEKRCTEIGDAIRASAPHVLDAITDPLEYSNKKVGTGAGGRFPG